MRRVFITGSQGAVGRSLIERLSQCSDEYEVCASARSSGQKQLDVCDHERLTSAIHDFNPHIVIHLAADFSDDLNTAYAVNVASSLALLQAAEQMERSPKVVLIGSAAEYGRVTPEECPVRESRILKPISVYGLTKAWQTELAYLYASRGIDVLVARIFNLYGDGLSGRLFAGRLFQQFKQIKSGSRSKLEFGDLSTIRDYVSITEAVEQLMRISLLGASGEVYHIASGEPVSMRDFLARQMELVGLCGVPVIENRQAGSRKTQDVPVIYADMSKTRNLINSSAGCVDD